MIQLNKKVAKNSLLVLMSTLVLLFGAAAALASTVTYKLRLGTYEDGELLYTTRNRWAVVKLKDNREFSVYHTTENNPVFF